MKPENGPVDELRAGGLLSSSVIDSAGLETATVVAVGIDGSDSSVDAMRWAADFAERCGARVRAVVAWEVPPIGGVHLDPSVVPPADRLETAAHRAIDRAVEALDRIPLGFERRIVEGNPVSVLTSVGSEPEVGLVVVGRRGLGRVRTALLGSTSRGLVHAAPCPVAVVPGGHHRVDGPMVVGVDTSPGALAALRWATDTPGVESIEAVYAWRAHHLFEFPPISRDMYLAQSATLLARMQDAFEATEQGTPKSGSPVVRFRAIEGDARSVLSSWNAALIVVGTRHGLRSHLVGSVPDALIVRSAVPVVVVPPTAQDVVVIEGLSRPVRRGSIQHEASETLAASATTTKESSI